MALNIFTQRFKPQALRKEEYARKEQERIAKDPEYARQVEAQKEMAERDPRHWMLEDGRTPDRQRARLAGWDPNMVFGYADEAGAGRTLRGGGDISNRGAALEYDAQLGAGRAAMGWEEGLTGSVPWKYQGTNEGPAAERMRKSGVQVTDAMKSYFDWNQQRQRQASAQLPFDSDRRRDMGRQMGHQQSTFRGLNHSQRRPSPMNSGFQYSRIEGTY